MLQLLGILIVLNTLVSAAWWMVAGRPWSAGLASLVVVGLVAGLALIFNQRVIEVVQANVAQAGAAAQQAQKEAQALTAMREKAEAEATEIGRLAKQVDEAQRLLADLGAARAKAEQAPVVPPAPSETSSATPAPATASGKKEKTENKSVRGVPKTREIIAPPASPKSAGVSPFQKGLLKQRFEEAIEHHKNKKEALAYVAARACVELYESSKDAGNKSGPDLGGVTLDGAAAIYSVAAEIAQRVGEHVRALEWAKRAVTLYPSAERKALLTTAYLNLQQREEADKIIKEATSQYDPASIELRALLTEFGIIRPKQP